VNATRPAAISADQIQVAHPDGVVVLATGLADGEVRAVIEALEDELSRRNAARDMGPSLASQSTIEERPAPRGCYRRELVRCGKPNCHCAAGEGGHGPYWYWYGRDTSSQLTSRYIGKRLGPAGP
jgi:hypothetical protein